MALKLSGLADALPRRSGFLRIPGEDTSRYLNIALCN